MGVNVNKNKVMVVCNVGRDDAKDMYEWVTNFSSLHIIFLLDGKWKQEIDRMMQPERGVLSSVSKHVVWNNNISLKV